MAKAKFFVDAHNHLMPAIYMNQFVVCMCDEKSPAKNDAIEVNSTIASLKMH